MMQNLQKPYLLAVKFFLSFTVLLFSTKIFAQSPANDVCGTSVALTINNAAAGTIFNANSTSGAGGCGGATAGTTYDVWYRFTATATKHTVWVYNLGSSLGNWNTYVQSYSSTGACVGLASLGCQTIQTAQPLTGLTIGNTYYVRLYVVANPSAAPASNWNFNIIVTTPPANDDCAGAVTLTSTVVTCTSPLSGTLNLATPSLPQDPNTTCVQWAYGYDVWYRFTAVASSQTISTGSFGGSYNNRQLLLYNACPTTASGAPTFIACGTNSINATGLTVGATYYVRVSDSWSFITSGGEFTICLTHPLTAAVNNTCASAFTLTSGVSCSPTTANIMNASSAATDGSISGSCGAPITAGTTYDVWFRFQATSTIQTITLSNLGSSMAAATTYIETFGGTCATLGAALGCQASPRQTLTGLTVGNFYYVRVYVKTNPNTSTLPTWNFDICIQSQPVNDECNNSTLLTSNITCTNTAGTLDLATANAATLSGCFPAGTYYDVWYRFLAVTPTHTITLSSLGANFTAQRMQIYSGTCGALTSVACVAGNTITQTGLTPGTVYYIRVANRNADPSGTGGVANFNICVTHSNDLCVGATQLTVATTCTNVTSSLLNMTATAGLPACGNAASADVWFQFTATSNFPVITLSNIGSDLTTAGPRIQLFSGSCGALVPVGTCSTSPLNTATNPGGTGLSVNTVYYVRITTNTNTGTPSSGNWGFDICITAPKTASVDYAKSYINVTNGTTGGTINTGDILEIRSTLVVATPGHLAWGTPVGIDNVAYYDTLFANKGLRLLKDSIALRTNEGKLYKPSASTYYTDAADADAAWITTGGVGTDTALRINMGNGANFSTMGVISNLSKPSNFGATCIVMATYRVRVTAAYGTTINYGGGAFRYRDTITGVSYVVNFPKDSIMVYSSPGSCPDGLSPTNIIGDEVNGTFGVPSGSAPYFQNRTTANTKYAYGPFSTGNPADYFYSVANNTSAAGATVQTVPKGDASRVFSVWDISGDHTGAANTAKGNPPCNLNLPISPSNPCGYMLAVNAAYRTDVAFQYNFSGACSETYYEISAWIKNICYRCGCDSNGVSASGGAGYIPTAAGDSAGIRPNIAFEINGVDYYTTGDLVYQGLGGTNSGSDTLNKWVRRAFVYKTKPGETSFTLTLRNNAPGGGGNDWAIDDIGIRTCYPNMTYSPSATPAVCAGSTLRITDTVRSFYDTYVNYKWQRYTTASGVWTDIAGTTGTATPVLTGGVYQYVVSYTLPPTATTMANNGDLYRLTVATTSANLGNGCGFNDIIPITITVNNCIDIDDDNDGIPDYVETNNPVALLGSPPNWNNPAYPGRVDNNGDGVDDRFDAGADADNDGIPNYMDTDFLFDGAFTDINGDGVNDRYDRDLDGIINQYDLDSDNDGIPDVVESYGADTDGNGIIDGYVDNDNDGFSSNVDGSVLTGVAGSGVGLGAQDLDGDGIPNFLDSDSDSDGIPDVVEVGGGYSTNNGRLAGFVDANKDGISDNNVNVTALLLTGSAINILTNGRATDFPYKNLDRDYRPNAYDLDSDGDGIVDAIEAGGGITDTNLDGRADGTTGTTNGWSTSVSALATLTLRNTDGVGNADYVDIDSDEDGIPDNIEGMSTAGYQLPTTTDADGDGLTLPYDNLPAAYGGSGIFLYDNDVDGTPDYRDLDTDGDGSPDVCEGNDWNFNGFCDETLTLTGLDTDGDGLDNRFDSLNSVLNVKGTSYNMGNFGAQAPPSADATPGTKATVQKKTVAQGDRDWRWAATVLPVQFLSFTGALQNTVVNLNWAIITQKPIAYFEIERSTDNITYNKAGTVTDAVQLNRQQQFLFDDDISGINSTIIYYRLKAVGQLGEVKYSNILAIRRSNSKTVVIVMPNPANDYIAARFYIDKEQQVIIRLLDNTGKTVLEQKQKVLSGNNVVQVNNLSKFSNGVYTLQLLFNAELITQKVILQH